MCKNVDNDYNRIHGVRVGAGIGINTEMGDLVTKIEIGLFWDMTDS